MTESDLSSWSTDYLGRMVKICRQRVREAQEAFAASQQEERRMRKQLARTEDDEAYARRLADELEAMTIELRRRTIAAVVESEVTL